MQAANLRIPALLVTIFAWIVLAGALATAISLAIWLVSYSQFVESPVMVVVVGIASAITQIAYLPSVVVVMTWIYMAHANLHRAGLPGLNYSPAWATFSFLVPIANLLIPYRAMRELANRSAGEPEELADADKQDVFAWWGCWIGSFVVGLFLAYTVLVALIPGIWMTTPFWATQVLIILANVLTAGSAFYIMRIVRTVTSDQQEGASAVSAFE